MHGTTPWGSISARPIYFYVLLTNETQEYEKRNDEQSSNVCAYISMMDPRLVDVSFMETFSNG